MKINPSFAVKQERFLPAREKNIEMPSFQKLLQEKQGDLTKERLQTLLSKLDQCEERLSHSQSIQDLANYKQTIREFINEVVQTGLVLEEHQGFSQNGREKRLKIIKQVDQKLIELSEQVLQKQAPTIELLKKMGEIKGLLLNLYF